MISRSTQDEKRCSRLWETDAVRDGRLRGDKREDARRHQDGCDVCRERIAYLEGLGQALRALDEPDVNPRHLRDLRELVLERADADRVLRGPLRRGPSRTVLAMAALTAALVAFLLARVVIPTNALPASALRGAAPSTTVEAVGGQGTRWVQRTDGEVERIELTEGTLHLHVDRSPSGRRVVVSVPDGEIEDVGTVFRVVVQGGHTQQVDVDEGRVTLRLDGMPALTLSAKATWSREQEARVVAASPAEPPRRAHAVPTPPALTALPPSKPSSTTESPVPPATAAEEDACYLRAIQLLREGRREDAKREAKDYLRKFPDGFRREEMGRVAE